MKVFLQCAHHGWYLSVDTQLYALSPLFLFPFLRNPKRVISVLVGLIVALVLDAFVISWVNKLGVNFVQYVSSADGKYLLYLTPAPFLVKGQKIFCIFPRTFAHLLI